MIVALSNCINDIYHRVAWGVNYLPSPTLLTYGQSCTVVDAKKIYELLVHAPRLRVGYYG